MIVPRPEDQWEQIEKLIPDALLASQHLASLNEELHEEVDVDYQLAIRTAIGSPVYFMFLHIETGLHCKNDTGKFAWKSCIIYLQSACNSAPHAFYLQCLRLLVILAAIAVIFTWGSSCWTSGELHAVNLRVTWSLPVVQVILSDRLRQFYVSVAGNFTGKSRQTASNRSFSRILLNLLNIWLRTRWS